MFDVISVKNGGWVCLNFEKFIETLKRVKKIFTPYYTVVYDDDLEEIIFYSFGSGQIFFDDEEKLKKQICSVNNGIVLVVDGKRYLPDYRYSNYAFRPGNYSVVDFGDFAAIVSGDPKTSIYVPIGWEAVRDFVQNVREFDDGGFLPMDIYVKSGGIVVNMRGDTKEFLAFMSPKGGLVKVHHVPYVEGVFNVTVPVESFGRVISALSINDVKEFIHKKHRVKGHYQFIGGKPLSIAYYPDFVEVVFDGWGVYVFKDLDAAYVEIGNRSLPVSMNKFKLLLESGFSSDEVEAFLSLL